MGKKGERKEYFHMFGRREKRMENGVGFYSFQPTKLNPSKLRGKYG